MLYVIIANERRDKKYVPNGSMIYQTQTEVAIKIALKITANSKQYFSEINFILDYFSSEPLSFCLMARLIQHRALSLLPFSMTCG